VEELCRVSVGDALLDLKKKGLQGSCSMIKVFTHAESNGRLKYLQWHAVWSATISLAVAIVFSWMPLQGFAEVITYTWFNAPSVQQNNSGTITTKTLSGTITVDTTALTSIGEGQWRIEDNQESSITAWNFSVTGGATSYSRSDQSTDPFIDIAGGGSFSLVASRTQLSVLGGASLFLGNSTSPSETAILWDNGQSGHQYVSNRFGNVNPDGWVTSAATTIDPEATLDAAFPSDGLGGWVIATAVPEPSSWAMALGGVAAFFWRRSRRSRRSR
jgi:hypothetical protein